MFNLSKIKEYLEKPAVKALRPWVTLAIVLSVLALAVWVIFNDVKHLSVYQVLGDIKRLPRRALFMGIGLTFLSYIFLIFYDWMGTKYAELCACWHQTAVASFCSYVISHNLGCPAVTGAAVRYRLYRGWGARPTQIGSIIGFCSLTFLIGILGLIVVVTLTEPHLFARLAHMPVIMMYLISAFCAVLIGLYVILCRVGTSLKLGGQQICLPKWKLAIGQLLFGMLEMACTAAILWAFLGNTTFYNPSGLNFLGFLGIYLTGYFAGVTAGTPGGLGVFDGFILVTLAPFFTVAEIFGGLILFRIVYSLIPFIIASLLFCGQEVKQYGRENSRFSLLNFFKKDMD